MTQAEHYISELLSERAAAEGRPKAAIVRWVLVAELLEPGDTDVSLDVCGSDNLTAWQAYGLAKAIEKNADAGWIIEGDD